MEKSAEDRSSQSSDQQLILNDDPSSENIESSDDEKNTKIINIKVEHYYAVITMDGILDE